MQRQKQVIFISVAYGKCLQIKANYGKWHKIWLELDVHLAIHFNFCTKCSMTSAEAANLDKHVEVLAYLLPFSNL